MEANRCFNVICTVDSNNNDNIISEEFNVHIDWSGYSKTSLYSYSADILKKTDYKLSIVSPSISVNVTPDSVIYRYIEIKLNINSIRSHSRYFNMGCWYDWSYFRWYGFDQNITTMIIIMLYLSECDMTYITDAGSDITPSHSNTIPLKY